MRLFATIPDPDLFIKALSEAGTAFYHIVSQTNEETRVETVYFSSNRTVYFKGDVKPAHLQARRIKEKHERIEILVRGFLNRHREIDKPIDANQIRSPCGRLIGVTTSMVD